MVLFLDGYYTKKQEKMEWSFLLLFSFVDRISSFRPILLRVVLYNELVVYLYRNLRALWKSCELT